MNPTQIVELVQKLNYEIYDQNPKLAEEFLLVYCSMGDAECIKVSDFVVWDGENDSLCVYNHGGDDIPISLEDFVRSKLCKLIKDIGALNI